MKIVSTVMIIGFLVSTTAFAQDSQVIERKIVAEKIQTDVRQAIGYSIDAKTVKGAPYSASAENETTQSLADGNRIHNKSVTQVYRDNDGRTRREVQSRSGGPAQIFISDPVTGTNYTLDPAQRLAIKREANRGFVSSLDTTMFVTGVMLDNKAQLEKEKSRTTSDESAVVAKKLALDKQAQAAVGMSLPRIEASPVSPVVVSDLLYTTKADNRESLGKQVIEGVLCEGKRTTITIPANTIGNDLPINIVNEEWYSPELQVLVLTRHSDPRVGETVYRLTGIVRSEQPKDLFEPPSDYTVRDLAKPVPTRRIKEEQ